MNFKDYVALHRRTPLRYDSADIIERWNKRVLKGGYQNFGEEGGDRYLDKYSRKKTGVPKLIKFAIYAENEGYHDFALAFWKQAYAIEYPNGDAVVTTARTPQEIFPAHLQPGVLGLGAPTSYIVFATPDEVIYHFNPTQKCLARVEPPEMYSTPLQDVTRSIGSFIAEVEKVVDAMQFKILGVLWQEGFGDLPTKEMQVEGAGLVLDFLKKVNASNFV